MTVEKNQVFLEDNNSKFGTLILVQCPNIMKIYEYYNRKNNIYII